MTKRKPTNLRKSAENDARLKAEVGRLENDVIELDALRAEKQAADRATFDMIRAFTVLKDEHAALKAEVKRLTDALNKLTNTPANADGVDLKVNFWTKGGTRLPSSFQTFWMHDSAKEGRDAK